MLDYSLPPVNVWLASLLWGAALVLFNEWLMEVGDE